MSQLFFSILHYIWTLFFCSDKNITHLPPSKTELLMLTLFFFRLFCFWLWPHSPLWPTNVPTATGLPKLTALPNPPKKSPTRTQSTNSIGKWTKTTTNSAKRSRGTETIRRDLTTSIFPTAADKLSLTTWTATPVLLPKSITKEKPGTRRSPARSTGLPPRGGSITTKISTRPF